MSYALPKTYDFKSAEMRIYAMWEAGGYFKPWNDPNNPGFNPNIRPFVISMPPPNVTGELHLGHAMFVSMEDLMIRYYRMKGYPTLWVPGTDHAGIATQLMVERALANEGLSREKLGREKFLERVWQWKEKYGGIITQQIRRLGASCDWERERFTLDPGLSRAVREAFVRLYEKGLIYRGPRLINWSPGLRTALSDLEVEYGEEQVTLYYFKYMLADGSGEYIPVATIRPETILGDTAVAVHPEDERYRRYVGQKVIVPMLGREIPVIADEDVSREFGSGALKVTPAHDPADYAIAQRHNLPMILVLDEAGRMNENAGPYAGLDRFECRKKLWADMEAAGLTLRTEPYTTSIPRAQRGGEIIEPMLSTQWFVRVKPLAQAAIEAVRSGRIRIVPERFEKVYFNWLENIEDWCISRQLWWGHRIPAWYCADCGKETVAREDPTHCAHCGSARIEQDPDVLDTWFSSGLWPFSTLGWPEETPDYLYFYPTSIMETGYDILFFWVARMIMMGLEFTGKEPFHTVYLHGLVRDEHDQKMSKTKGNVIDPLLVMEQFGTDALRFTLLVGSTPGNDTNLSISKVEANRNFANKLWNAGRLVISLLQKAPAEPLSAPHWTLADRFILARLKQVIRDVERLFQHYQYGQAGQLIYDFFWADFADWYLEIAKLQVNEGGDRAFYTVERAVQVFDAILRLLHPFVPFVTEEIYGHLRRASLEHSASLKPIYGRWNEVLITAPWPEALPIEGWEEDAQRDFEQFRQLVRAIRNLRAEKNVRPEQRLAAILVTGEKLSSLYQQEKSALAMLARLDETRLEILPHLHSRPAKHIVLVEGELEIYLPVAEMMDEREERARLEKELHQLEAQIQRLEKLLAGEFSQKAPAHVVQKERQRLEESKRAAAKIRQKLS
ncbi:MAG: valine--tRNA ligase [Anaerolineales bacterium]